jgi:hypothetical protein
MMDVGLIKGLMKERRGLCRRSSQPVKKRKIKGKEMELQIAKRNFPETRSYRSQIHCLPTK